MIVWDELYVAEGSNISCPNYISMWRLLCKASESCRIYATAYTYLCVWV